MNDTTLTINNIPYVTLPDYATEHGMDVKRLRRYVRNTDTVPARKWGPMWLIERDADITLPDATSRGRRRPDGRQRFVVYIDTNDPNELQSIIDVVGVSNVVNPRELARTRRADAKTV